MKRIMAIGMLAATAALFGFKQNENPLQGSWVYQSGDEYQVLLLADGYLTHTGYNINGRKFHFTKGGPYTLQDNRLVYLVEFNTKDKAAIGDSARHLISVSGDKLMLHTPGGALNFKRDDNGKESLAGLWRITGRKRPGEESVAAIHQTGPRKTIKILSGNRFQWAAINPATKEFSGSGGGTYTFKDGKYIERIEFFSRDSSRVGASLQFDGRLDNGHWHHSGSSSKGDPIYEIWSRVQ